MFKNLMTYFIAIFVLGLFFSGLTISLVRYLPYVVAGLVLTAPVYGYLRISRRNSHRKENQVFPYFRIYVLLYKIKERFFKLTKKSVAFYAILTIVVFNAYTDIFSALADSFVLGIKCLVVAFVMWEVTRAISHPFMKKPLVTFGEAIKGVF